MAQRRVRLRVRRPMLPLLLWLAVLPVACLTRGAHAATTLIATGSVWKYFDAGVDLGTTWRNVNFNDAAWPSGPAQLGFGDGDEATSIAGGIDPKPITTYFRHTLVLTNSQPFPSLTARVLSDDGAVVYVNGFEIFRINMAGAWGSPVPHAARALTPLADADEGLYRQRGAYYIWPGTNVVAVEIHQAEGGEADGSFDLELIGGLPITPPTVSMTQPVDGALLPFEPVELAASVGDLDGHVYEVQYFVRTSGATASVGLTQEEPFRLTWHPPHWGRFALWARAVDNSGRSALSAPVHVTVGAVEAIGMTRGPYLQGGSATGMVVRWRTDWFADAWVAIGTHPDLLDTGFTNAGFATEHEVRLTGLAPNTKYFYAVGYSNRLLAAGQEFHFVTAPTNAKPTRIWAIGDFGTADQYQAAVRDAYSAFAQGAGGERPTDFWLMLGDNAYEVGTDEEYQAAVFDMYAPLLRRSVAWPTLGNHDASSSGVHEEFPYLEIFSLPRQGEAGGVASGTERYYSFDYGNIHVVCLDSQSSDRQPGRPMLNWLEQDLAATTKDWILAFWHHPPYSFGTHNSDWELQMVEMRQHVLPVLEAHGVDVVLTGHSHNYERSFLLHGHYGSSGNLVPSMILNGGSGQEDNDGPYQKPALGSGAQQGTVYVVCGCSGQGGFFAYPRHPAKAVNLSGFGSVVLDIEGARLDARFLSYDGALLDGFTIHKGEPRPKLRISLGDATHAQVAWPTSTVYYGLEQSLLPGSGAAWTTVTNAPALQGRSNVVTVPLDKSNAVFRLRAPAPGVQ